MTEIPEHLLKRSRDRRAALGLGGGEPEGGAETAAEGAAKPAPTGEAATPAPVAPSGPAARQPAPAPEAEPPPKPDPPYVAAAKSRAKIPFWAMAALSMLPIWAFMYVRALTAEPAAAAGPLGVGAEVYSGSCQSCHLAGGVGSPSARQLNDGEVWLTFPNIEDQLRFVYFGTVNYNLEGISIYGDPDREGGPHRTGSVGAMPGWGDRLADEEILAAVCHTRFGLSGAPELDADEAAAEFELWCSEESPAFAALEAGTPLADLDDAELTTVEGEPVDIIDIGDAPAEGRGAEE